MRWLELSCNATFLTSLYTYLCFDFTAGASPVPGCEADATKFVEDMKAADVTLSLSTDVFLGV